MVIFFISIMGSVDYFTSKNKNNYPILVPIKICVEKGVNN